MNIQQYYLLLKTLSPPKELSSSEQLIWLKSEKAKLLKLLSDETLKEVLANDARFEKKMQSSAS